MFKLWYRCWNNLASSAYKHPQQIVLNYKCLRVSLVAQLIRIYLQCRRPRFDSLVGQISWRRDRLPVFLGYPAFLASLVAQMVKNPQVMWETWVPSLGWEDPLEEGMATHSSILYFCQQSPQGNLGFFYHASQNSSSFCQIQQVILHFQVFVTAVLFLKVQKQISFLLLL